MCRTHTTRRLGSAVLTRGPVQVVFSDTPGVVTREEADRFKLEKRLVEGPGAGCAKADLILVLQVRMVVFFFFLSWAVLLFFNGG